MGRVSLSETVRRAQCHSCTFELLRNAMLYSVASCARIQRLASIGVGGNMLQHCLDLDLYWDCMYACIC